MVRLISFLIAVGLAVAGAVWLANHPGEVMVQWLGWRVDTSVPVLLVAAVLLVLVVSLLVRLVLGVLTVPGVIGRFRSRRALKRGLLALAEAESALLTHDAAKAARKAAQAKALLPNQQAAVLIQAEAALLRDDLDGAQALYEGLLETRSSALAALHGLLALAEKRNDKGLVRDVASRAVAVNERAAWAVRPLFTVLADAGDWAAAQKTLDLGCKREVFSEAERARLTATLLCAQADAALLRGETHEVARLTKKAVSAAPGFLPAVLRHAQSLISDGNGKKAAALLIEPWRTAPHPALAAAYLSLWQGEEPLKRVQHVDALADSNPSHPESCLLAAEAALQAGLWGQARTRLKPLLDRGLHERRLALLMARLEESEHGNATEALRWYKLAAAWDSQSPAPTALWQCDQCHTPAADWSVHCPTCNTIGSVTANV